MERRTNQFRVQADSGEVFVVCEFARIPELRHMQGRRSMTSRSRTLRTEEGYDVTQDDETTFRIIDLDLIARRIPD